MKKPPTKQDPTPEQGNDKPERIVSVTIDGRKFQVVGELTGNPGGLEGARRIEPGDLEPENRRAELSRLTAVYRMAAEKHPDDHEAVVNSWHLLALSDPRFGKVEKRDQFARSSRDYYEKNNRGPRTRPQEADGLLGLIDGWLEEGLSNRDTAERAVHILRIFPLLRADTCVPAAGVPWSDEDREKAVAAVELAFEKATNPKKREPESLAQAMMRALGCPSSKAKNLFAHHDARARRS